MLITATAAFQSSTDSSGYSLSSGRVGVFEASSDLLDQLPRCTPAAEALDAVPPPHPYAPGDPACDARYLAVLRPEISRNSPRTPLPGLGPARHVGYHYAGPWTDYSAVFGIFTGRRVTNPSLTAGDTMYATMHVCSPGCADWGEVGWYKFGSNGYRGIFVYDPDFGFHDYRIAFPITTGQILHMQISWDGDRFFPDWYVWLWWNGYWNLIDVVNIDRVESVYTDLVAEEITDASHFALPITQVDGTLLESCLPNCSWYAWDTTVPNSGYYADWPYHPHFQSQYYKWYAHTD